MATQNLVLMKPLYYPQTTGNNDDMQINVEGDFLYNDVQYHIQTSTVLDASMTKAQADQAVIDAIKAEVLNQHSVSLNDADVFFQGFVR